MALSNQELLSELSAKPIMEIVELVKMLEDSWGVSAAAPVAVAAAGGGGLDLDNLAPQEVEEVEVEEVEVEEEEVEEIAEVTTTTPRRDDCSARRSISAATRSLM